MRVRQKVTCPWGVFPASAEEAAMRQCGRAALMPAGTRGSAN